MGDLLARVARQPALLDAWQEIRDDAADAARLTPEYDAFERDAARRLAEVSDLLLSGTWRQAPVRRLDLTKPGGGVRHLGIPLLADRIVEKAVLGVLDRLVDPELLPWSYAYRRGLGVRDAVRVLLDTRDGGLTWVVRGDFADCFDEIPRARVLDRLASLVPDGELLEVVRLLVYRPVRGEDGSSPKGLHQGAPLSPLLANLYLSRLDRAWSTRQHGVLVRYADDCAPRTQLEVAM